MALKLRDYDARPRIASVVSADLVPCNDGYDHVVVHDGYVTLVPADLRFSPQDGARTNALGVNDIVTINERGVVRQIHDGSDQSATVFITGACNSNCVMCPCSDLERKSNDGLGDDWLMSYIHLLPQDLAYIVVTGGEPTLRTRRFLAAMELLAYKYPRTETLLLTNGRSFASKALLDTLLKSCPPLLTAGIPIHAPSETLHDAITQAPGSFRQTRAGISNLLTRGVSVELRIVVSKLNLHVVPQIADLIIQDFPQVGSVKLMGLEALGSCARNFDTVYIDHQQSWPVVREAATRLMKAGIETEVYNYPLCAVDVGFWSICRKSITPYKVRYLPQCDECMARDLCGGFFASTMYRARPTVTPIRSGDE